jgi:SAM-dependent methyltransferase
MKCRHCSAPLELTLIDLGSAPPSNAYLAAEDLDAPEKWYPLRVMVCEHCWLVQTRDFAKADELFSADYAYYSSYSTSWLDHSRRYVEAMIERFRLDASSHVVEVASNDGYLLQYVRAAGIPCTGVEPTAGTAQVARARGIETVESFFGVSLASRMAERGQSADLTVANNVLAHVPDINDFVAGFAHLLKPAGVATFEFPHLLRLLGESQFDTIYHEHFSYLSFTVAKRIFAANGLQVFDVERLPTHGGSLRVYAQRADTGRRPLTAAARDLEAEERAAGVCGRLLYSGLQSEAQRIKNDLVTFLTDAKRDGRTVAAYGAAAKGNTLLNFAGCRGDLVAYVADRNPAKQNKFMPGSRIPIVAAEQVERDRPDFILILPWNLRDEIVQQLSGAKAWGARFVTAIPRLEISS